MRVVGAVSLGLALGMALIFHGVAVGQTPAAASCPPTTPPPAPYVPPSIPPRPAMPSCVNPNTMVGNCRKPVIERYNQDIAAYNQLIEDRNRGSRAYINALNDWVIAAGHYTQCEVDRVNSGVPR